MARRARRTRARGRHTGGHVYHFAVFTLLMITISLFGTIGLSVTGGATGFEAGAYSMDSFQMIGLMWILSLAFLIPAEIMIRNSRT